MSDFTKIDAVIEQALKDLEVKMEQVNNCGVTTLRDRFAMAALSGLLAFRKFDELDRNTRDEIAFMAYQLADSMLSERGDGDDDGGHA